MQIIKKINNNVALGLDAKGNEVIVFGKGVGFHHTPYELEDSSVITRVFRNVDERVVEAISDISDAVLLAASDIVDLAATELDGNLNPGLAFSMADHIQFAIDRTQQGYDIQNPLSPDVAYVYPCEYEVGRIGLGIIQHRTGVELPAHEASSLALHIVSAEAGEASGDVNLVMKSTALIEQSTEIIEQQLSIKIDRTSFAYARFAAHFRFLVSRLMKGGEVASGNSSLFEQAAKDFPKTYSCAAAIQLMLQTTHGWTCSNEELLYLMMHINRLAVNQ